MISDSHPTPVSNRFPKRYRLHHRTLVEGLFASGKSLYEYPLRMQWRVLSEEDLKEAFRHGIPEGIGCVQVMITVPKRKRRRAVDRVRARRRIREAYRLSRHPLEDFMEAHGEFATLQIGFIHIADSDVDYDIVRHKMEKLISRLVSLLTAMAGGEIGV